MVTVILMMGAEASDPASRWVAGGRLAAARDALELVRGIPEVDRVVVALPPALAREVDATWPVEWAFDPPAETFHFGRRLAALAAHYPDQVYLYLGAGSMPLMTAAVLQSVVAEVVTAHHPLAVTNNRLSSDWMVFNCPTVIGERAERLERDNMLGYVLRHEAGVEVRSLPASAATRLDIDTPADLLLLSQHPRCPAHLAAYLRAEPRSAAHWMAARQVLFTPGGRVALIGRVSAAVWGHVEAHTRAWIRVFSEERGMSASGRLAAGQVRSLLADYLLRCGPVEFFAEMSATVDAVIFDTRVVFAHAGRWPSAADRYASDLGQTAVIMDPVVQQLTAAAGAAPIPVVLGGHGVVAGDLYGLLEMR